MVITALENAANACIDVQVDLASRLGWKRSDPRLDALEHLVRSAKYFGAKISYSTHDKQLFVQRRTFGVKVQCDSVNEINNVAVMLDFTSRVLDDAFDQMRQAEKSKKAKKQEWGEGLEKMFRARFPEVDIQETRDHRPPTIT